MKHPIPLEILEQHMAVLGKTGSGKSSVLRGLIEKLLDANKRVCIIDPKGDHYGIKLGADGRSAGYGVMALGDFKDIHATDIHINDRSGKEIAELIVSGNRPAVIGFRGWMPGAMNRFMIDFESALFNKNNAPLYLVVDEVQNFAPKGKILDPNIGMMLHWTNRIGAEGRGIGLRIIMASQRPQKVHNDLLTCAETLVAMRVTHPSDRSAIHDWLKDYSDDNERGKMVLSNLAEMKRGEAFVWSPEAKFFERVNFPMFKTFDSFAAPKDGDKRVLKGWATVDLEEVKEKLSKVIEEAKENDPKELKQEINRLKALIRTGPPAQVNEKAIYERAEASVKAQTAAIIAETEKNIIALRNRLIDRAEAIESEAREIQSILDKLGDVVLGGTMKQAAAVRAIPVKPDPAQKTYRPVTEKVIPSEGGGEIDKRILDTIATLEYRGIRATRESIARWMGIHPTGGRYGTNLATLRAEGFIDGFSLTEKGRHIATVETTGIEGLKEALLRHKEGSGRVTIIEAILNDSRRSLTRNELAEVLGIHPTGGRYGTNLGWLRTMGVLPDRGSIELTDGAKK